MLEVIGTVSIVAIAVAIIITSIITAITSGENCKEIDLLRRRVGDIERKRYMIIEKKE
jgi:hypothetical protein